MALPDTLSAVGIGAFGSAMPVLAPSWTSGTPTAAADGLSLTLAVGSWLSPLAAFVRTPTQVEQRSGVLLRGGDGARVPSGASVLSLYPQQYLRLGRLYALVLEDPATARPGRALGRPTRPVPAHVVLADGGLDGATDPGDPLVGGALSIHDQHGQPIDPVAVAAAFVAMMTAHEPLQHRAIGDDFDADPPLAAMVTALAPAASVRVRLVDGAGRPAAGTHLTGLTALGSSGMFTVADLTATVGKDAAGAGFTEEQRRTLVLGVATTGRLGDTATFPARPAGATALTRDFFTVTVLDLAPYLIGTPEPQWDGTKVEPRPVVRRDEPLTLLADGNDVLGAASAALASGPTESLAVAPRIDGGFAAPDAAGPAARWPDFPPPGAVVPAPAGPVPIALGTALTPTAAFVDEGTAAVDIDVALTLNGLPAGAAVRAYHRVFSADAVETRGDGTGAVADGTGTARLLLRDPLGLHPPGGPAPVAVPAGAILHVDVVVVKRTGEARIFGDVTVPITGTAAAPPGATNSYPGAARRAVCNAGILGLGTTAAPAVGIDPLAAALALLSEGTPRDAPRLPGMARRDLLVAGLQSGSWSAVLGAGRLAAELHNANPRLGAPGGAGGRETQAVGVATAGGRLAFDIARAALRRTTSVVTRLGPLAGAAWNEPPVPAAGTFAGAVLQTVASGCETPELSLLRTLNVVDPDDPNLPTDFDALLDRLQTWLTSVLAQLPAGLPQEVTTRLQELIDRIDELADDRPADESTRERIFNELRREISASGWGRRDAQWALRGALERAQRFVYVETPGLGPTAGPGATDPFAADLFAVLSSRLAANPALHVVVCCPEQPDFPFGFTAFGDYERFERHAALLNLPTASLADPVGSRVVAFHPIGFPGRPSRLESTVVVVDDTWAMVGSSTLRRRGLAFDGGADLVLTDLELVEGRSAAIAALRRSLQAARLGVAVPGAPPAVPTSSFVRLGDGVEAFHEIREMLRGGGLGRIARLAPAEPVGRPIVQNRPVDAVNPDGETVSLVELLPLLALAGAATA